MSAKTPKHAFEEFDWLHKFDPTYDNARRDLGTLMWTPENPSLPVKYREIIAAVVLAYRKYHTTEAHIRRAIAEGASLREVLEGFQTAAVPGGFPVLHFALPIMIEIHREVGDDAMRYTGTSATKTPVHAMGVWDWMEEFDPTYNDRRRQLTSLVWAPKESAMPVKIRELVAAAVLAYRGYATVDEHLRRAVREGASVSELVEAMQVAAMPGGFPCLHFTLPFIIKIEEDLQAGTFT